jgi:hypothetical protein
MTSKRNINSRIDDLESTDEEDNDGAVYIYDIADADEPACIVGGNERD